MITFNFKKEKKQKEEEFPNFPVLIQLPYNGEGVSKFQLSSKALTLLGYPEDLKDSKISIAREQSSNATTTELILVNTTGTETLHQYNVNKDGSFNSQFLSKKLEKYYFTNPAEKTVFMVEQLGEEDVYAGIIKLYREPEVKEPQPMAAMQEPSSEVEEYDEMYVNDLVDEETLI